MRGVTRVRGDVRRGAELGSWTCSSDFTLPGSRFRPGERRRTGRRWPRRRGRPTRSGFRDLTLMDHWFQMEALGGPRRTRCSRATRRSASWPACTERMRLGLLVTGRDLPPSRAAGQDGHDARRALRRPGPARHRRRLVRARAPGARRAVPAAGRALRAARGDAADLPADVERRRRPLRRPPLPAGRDDLPAAAGAASPRPPILIGGSGEKKTLRLVAQYADACNLFADLPGGGRAQARRARRALRRPRAATPPRSRRRSHRAATR